MNTRRLSLLTGVVIYSATVFAQTSQLNITPEHPAPGQSVMVTTDNIDTRLQQVVQVNFKPDLALLFEPGKVPGKLSLPVSDSVVGYILLTGVSARQPQQAHAIVSYQGAMPVKEANFLVSKIIGDLVKNGATISNGDSLAVASLENEFRFYPDSKRKHIADYLYALGAYKKKEASVEIVHELDALGKQSDLSAGELLLLTNLYGLFDQPAKAAKYAAILQKQAPGGAYDLAKHEADVFDEENYGKKLQFYRGLQNSGEVYALYHNTINQYLIKDDFTHVNALLANKPKEVRARTFTMVASSMLIKNQDATLAKKYADWGYESAQESFNHPKDDYDKNYSKFNVGKGAEIIGAALSKQGKYKEALAFYDEGKKYTPQSTNLDLEQLYLIAMAHSDRYAEVKKRLEERVKKSQGSTVIKEALQEAYRREKKEDKGFDEYYATLQQAVNDTIAAHVKNSIMYSPAPDFTLEDLQGKQVTLSSLRGKVVVLDFWATWCGPCVASFPGMQQAQEKYKNDKDVVFLFVNSWENVADVKGKVSKFVNDKKLPFTVLLDANDKAITAYGIKGIPSKFIIDKDGNIRFSTEGYSYSQEAFVTELTTMIELTKKG